MCQATAFKGDLGKRQVSTEKVMKQPEISKAFQNNTMSSTSTFYLCNYTITKKVALCIKFYILFCFALGFSCLGFFEMVSLCSPCCLETHFVDKAGLELRNKPVSAS